MKREDWFKLKDELISLDIVSQVDLRFFNHCMYNDNDEDYREWEEKIWMDCPIGCILNRKRISTLLDFSDKHNLEIEITNGEEIKFTERLNETEYKE